MKKLIAIFVIFTVFGSPAFAAQQGTTYGGIQYALVSFDDGLFDVDPTALVGRLGQYLTENFAIEGRLGFGVQDDSDDFFGLEVDVDVESLLGIYGVFHASTDSDTSVYGVIGFSDGEAEFSALGDSISDDESGLSFGFGVNIGNFNLEYMNYLDEDDFEATAISLGYRSEFD